MSTIAMLAERAVSGLPAAAMEGEGPHVAKLDPITITTIFTTVIDGLIRCRKAKNGDDAGAAYADMQEEVRTKPVLSRARVKKRIRDAAWKDHSLVIRNKQSNTLADQLIAQSSETTQEEFAAAYAEVA